MHDGFSVYSLTKYKCHKDTVCLSSFRVCRVFSTAQEQFGEVQKNRIHDITQTPVGGQMAGRLRPAGSGATAPLWLLFRPSASTSPVPRAPDSELRRGGQHSTGTDPQRTGPGPAPQTSTPNPDERPVGSDAAWLEQSKGCGQVHHTELKTKKQPMIFSKSHSK